MAIALAITVGGGGFVLVLPFCVVYLTIAVCMRLVWRWRLRRQVDKALEQIRVATTLQARQHDHWTSGGYDRSR